MINLRKSITSLLETYHSKVYFEQAPETATFPYVVYTFPNSFTNEDQEVLVMDIDIWDVEQDTTALESLSTTLWKSLNKHHYINDNIQFTIYRSNRLPELEDDNPRIKRRKLIFEVKYFDRE